MENCVTHTARIAVTGYSVTRYTNGYEYDRGETIISMLSRLKKKSLGKTAVVGAATLLLLPPQRIAKTGHRSRPSGRRPFDRRRWEGGDIRYGRTAADNPQSGRSPAGCFSGCGQGRNNARPRHENRRKNPRAKNDLS